LKGPHLREDGHRPRPLGVPHGATGGLGTWGAWFYVFKFTMECGMPAGELKDAESLLLLCGEGVWCVRVGELVGLVQEDFFA
jgi:hypothetical protein